MKKLGKRLLDLYTAIGAVAIGILAVTVIFTVIMRYCFSLNWKELSEFNVTLFAFTTFWGMGLSVLKNEHVIIDIFYDRFRPSIKRWIGVFDYCIVLVVDVLFTYYGWIYTLKAGKQMSMGMEIPMKYMYGIMPVCGALCALCIIIKIVWLITAPEEALLSQNIRPKEDEKP